MKLTDASLDQILNETIQLATPNAEQKGIQFGKRHEATGIVLRVDPARIQQC